MRVHLGERLEGPAGTAVHVSVEGGPADWEGSVSSWFITAPGQAAGWEHYVLGVVHLRPIEGVRPPFVKFPGATHEVLLYALDPGCGPRAADVETWGVLTPLNVVQQVVLPSDADAAGLVRLCAVEVVEGRLWAEPPLSGQVEPWRTVLDSTAAHSRGEHDAGRPAGPT